MMLSRSLAPFWRRLCRDRRGNALMIFAFALGPILFSTGMAIDYTHAASLRTKLNAIADAAALAAVTQPMMANTPETAKAVAIAMFDQQAANLPGLDATKTIRTVLVSEDSANAASGVSRSAKVTYTAQSVNAFAKILGQATITIGGVAEAGASLAPNTDFYMMVDTSPSMELPATSAGIAKMKSLTPTQGDYRGCAFACHQSDRMDPRIRDNPFNMATGQRMDNYELARKYNIVLRTDLVTAAIRNLATTAKSSAALNKASYRLALASFDYTYRDIVKSPSDPDTVAARAGDAVVPTVCMNYQRVCGIWGDDTSYFGRGFQGASANLPATGGTGSNLPNNSPQAILFIVTDGMRHDNTGIGPISTNSCTTIKARNIRIAILYTEYIPESVNDVWSEFNVQRPYLSPTDKVSPMLINCASPGLYYKVTTNGDISAAMNTLFLRTLTSARLTR